MKKFLLLFCIFLPVFSCEIVFDKFYSNLGTLKEDCIENNNCECYKYSLIKIEKDCSEGNSIACMALASTYINFKEPLWKQDKPLEYAKKACDNVSTDTSTQKDGCFSAGITYEERFINTKDENYKKEAIFYLKKACKKGYDTACNSLKRLD